MIITISSTYICEQLLSDTKPIHSKIRKIYDEYQWELRITMISIKAGINSRISLIQCQVAHYFFPFTFIIKISKINKILLFICAHFLLAYTTLVPAHWPFKNIYLLYFLCLSIWTAAGTHRVQKKLSNYLVLELVMIVSHHIGARNWICILCKNKCY